MSFGDFAMGYLLGQSFSGPSSVEPVMVPGKCQGDLDAEKDPDVIAAGEKAYWEAWDRACKEKVIERLRKHEKGVYLITLEQKSIYSHLSQDDIADLIEGGDLTLVCLENGVAAFWTDDSRGLRLKNHFIGSL